MTDKTIAQTKTVAGRTYETNSPTAPAAKVKNSSTVTQQDGPSLLVQAQGLLANTITEVNNLIPAAGCPIKLPNLLVKLNLKFQLLPEIEANRLASWASKLGDFVTPIIDQVKNWVESIKIMVKEIEDYLKEMIDMIKEIKAWVELTVQFVTFIMSLPARLANLITNCLTALVSGVTGYISDAFSTFTSSIDDSINQLNNISSAVSGVTGLAGIGVPNVPTTGSYTQSLMTIPPITGS